MNDDFNINEENRDGSDRGGYSDDNESILANKRRRDASRPLNPDKPANSAPYSGAAGQSNPRPRAGTPQAGQKQSAHPRRTPSADELLRETENRMDRESVQGHAYAPGAHHALNDASAHQSRPASPRRPVQGNPFGDGVKAGPDAVPKIPEAKKLQKASAPELSASAGTKKSTSVSADKVSGEKKKRKTTPALVSLLRSVIYIVAIVVVAACISVFVINMGNDIFAFVKSDEAVEVEIPDDPDIGDIADVLYDNGVIKYPSMFKFYARFKKSDTDFLTDNEGKTFTVSPSMNYDQLIDSFKEQVDNGRTWITIPEGYTVDEIISLMLSYGIGGSKEDYVDVINNYDFDYWFVQELENSGWSNDRYYRLEGYLFPDTYEFYNKSSAYTVVNKLLHRFDQVYVEDYKTQAAKLNLTTDQVVILASLIEKEAGTAADYRNVSSVFHNRLNNPARFPMLESDATIVYAIQHDTGERPEKLTDTNYDSPYNTYKNNGLPPGPIANPSASALRFAISPSETNFYYFYSSSNGYTYFASTYAEHQQNIKKYASANSGDIQ